MRMGVYQNLALIPKSSLVGNAPARPAVARQQAHHDDVKMARGA